MRLNSRVDLYDPISREAAEWLVEFRTGDVDSAGRRDFDAWLRTSPEHVRAFIEMAALWHEGGSIDSRHQLDVEAIMAQVEPPTAVHPVHEDVGSGRAWMSYRAVAASLLAAVLAAPLFLHSGAFRGSTTYTAGLREPRSIVLADGSKVLLDSKSRLRVSFTADTRAVELLQGQALFRITKDPQRPFLVHAGQAFVRDIGTVFDVDRIGDGTVVTVVEGRVAVAQGGVSPQPIGLRAGDQLDVRSGQLASVPIRVDTSAETAWTHGNVVLESATLSEVAQVFSRYSARPLVATDLGKTPLRLSGVFATNPDFLIRYLRGRPDVVVTETAAQIAIVRQSSAH